MEIQTNNHTGLPVFHLAPRTGSEVRPPPAGRDEHTDLQLWCYCGWEAHYTLIDGKPISGTLKGYLIRWDAQQKPFD